jgi:hypothetical protein
LKTAIVPGFRDSLIRRSRDRKASAEATTRPRFAAFHYHVLSVRKFPFPELTRTCEMREHPEGIRYALMGCFLHVRALEVTDDVTRMAIELIHRLDARSEKQIHRQSLADLERVEGEMQILSQAAEILVDRKTFSDWRRSGWKRPIGRD